MRNDYEDAIKSKLAELNLANKECARFQARNISSREPLAINDINDMSIAYSKNALALVEFNLLLERAYPRSIDHSAIIQDLEDGVEKAKFCVNEAMKRSL